MNLTPVDFSEAAALLGCDVATVRAVADVESPGGPFLPTGEPFILFEAHVFSRLTGHQYDRSHPSISSRTWNRSLYRKSAAEHQRLAQAVALDRTAALQSASWGQFQLMGFNWKRCGFATLQAFINAMYSSPRAHLMAFCRYIQSMGLADELQRHEWAAFASVYNGPSYAANNYDTKLATSWRAWSAVAGIRA